MPDQLSVEPRFLQQPRLNEYGQPIGEPLGSWVPPPLPERTPMTGSYCRLEPLEPEVHTQPLWDAFGEDADARHWTYLVHGPYASVGEFAGWVGRASAGRDPLFYALVADGRAGGVAAYMRITPEAGSIEVGHINLAATLRRSRAATEAMYLMMARAFALGYRRYEWKCDALNAPSRAAAERLGFRFEGIFRQATVYKGRNRDTAWYAMLDSEWPARRAAFERWLSPDNFDASGRQRARLSAFMADMR